MVVSRGAVAAGFALWVRRARCLAFEVSACCDALAVGFGLAGAAVGC